MQLVPYHGNSLPIQPQLANNQAEFQPANDDPAEIPVKINLLFRNLQDQIQECLNEDVSLRKEHHSDIVQAHNLGYCISQIENDESRRLRMESDKLAFEKNAGLLLKKIEENALRYQFLNNAGAYLNLILEEDYLLTENDVWTEIVDEMEEPDIKQIWTKAIQRFQVLNTIEEFRELLKSINNLPDKPREIWKSILESTSPAINAVPLIFNVKDKNGNVCDEEIVMTQPFSIWKAHGKVFEKACLSNNRSFFVSNVSEAGLSTFVDCLGACCSEKFLTCENLGEIMYLARSFEVEWLLKDCQQKVVPLFFYVTDKKGNVCAKAIETAVPFSIWRGHGKVFENACLSNNRSFFVSNASEAGLSDFLGCLGSCSSEKHMTDGALEEIMFLARSYRIEWLFRDCHQRVVVLMKVLHKIKMDNRYPDAIRRLSSELSSLARKCKLGDVQCFSEFGETILPDGTVSIKGSVAQLGNDKIGNLNHYVRRSNIANTAKIEFHISNFSAADGWVLNRILKGARCLVTVRIDGIIPADLNQILEKNPNLARLQIVFDCSANDPAGLFTVVEDNATLTSLRLCLVNYDNTLLEGFKTFWPLSEADANMYEDSGQQYKHEVYAAKRDLRKMVESNDRIRNGLEIVPMKVKVMQTNMKIDFDTYDKTQEIATFPSKKALYMPYIFYYSGHSSKSGIY